MNSHKHSKAPEQPSGEREHRERQDDQPIAAPEPTSENSHHPSINSIQLQLSQDQFLKEIQVAGFLGAYKFWSIVSKQDEGKMREYGNRVLRGLAQIAFRHRRERPWTPEEDEAFEYCALLGLK